MSKKRNNFLAGISLILLLTTNVALADKKEMTTIAQEPGGPVKQEVSQGGDKGQVSIKKSVSYVILSISGFPIIATLSTLLL